MLRYILGVLEKVVTILTMLTGQLSWLSIATFLLCQLLVMALVALFHESLVLADESVKLGLDNGGVLDDVVDVVVEVTIDVLLTFSSF